MAVDESKLPVESKKRAVRGAKATAVKKAAAAQESDKGESDGEQEIKKEPIVLGKKRKAPASSIESAPAPSKRRKKNADGS